MSVQSLADRPRDPAAVLSTCLTMVRLGSWTCTWWSSTSPLSAIPVGFGSSAALPLASGPVMRRRMKVAAPFPVKVLRLASWGTVQVKVAVPWLEQEVTAERSVGLKEPSRFQSIQPAILVFWPEQVICWLHFLPISVQITRSQVAGRASSSSTPVVSSALASAL